MYLASGNTEPQQLFSPSSSNGPILNVCTYMAWIKVAERSPSSKYKKTSSCILDQIIHISDGLKRTCTRLNNLRCKVPGSAIHQLEMISANGANSIAHTYTQKHQFPNTSVAGAPIHAIVQYPWFLFSVRMAKSEPCAQIQIGKPIIYF